MAQETLSTMVEQYKTEVSRRVRQTLSDMECQPIFFLGSGMSMRYASTPNWSGLLSKICDFIGFADYAYLRQKYDSDYIKIGSELVERVFEWAWKNKPGPFPEEFFTESVEKDIFLKFAVCKIVSALSVVDPSPLSKEIEYLKKTKPYAIVTTNYDNVVNQIFPDYEDVVGQKIIRQNLNVIGEIFKIHGSAGDPKSIVITDADYRNFSEKKKYISAKLLTYFSEHPVFIFGYGLNDPNVKSIISDISEILSENGGVISNIYYVQWIPSISERDLLHEHVFDNNGSAIRMRYISVDDYRWLFDVISENTILKNINVKLLRALAARTFKLIRKDIPNNKIEVDYSTLNDISHDDGKLPTLLGIATISSHNMSHPHLAMDIAPHLGFPKGRGGAAKVARLFDRIRKEKGVDIRSSDNKYHECVKTGKKSQSRKYSHTTIDLLKKVKAGEPYEIILD